MENKEKNKKEAPVPYGLTKEEFEMISNMLNGQAFKVLIKSVYPKIREGMIYQMLEKDKTMDEINILRGELRAFNQFIQAPVSVISVKKPKK